MIARLWHGWTTPENSDAYERLLKTEIFPGILAKEISGFRHIELLRRDLGDDVEFITIMWFDDWPAVKAFAGAEYENSYVPDSARKVLKRFDKKSGHYEIRERRAATEVPVGGRR